MRITRYEELENKLRILEGAAQRMASKGKLQTAFMWKLKAIQIKKSMESLTVEQASGGI